MDDLKRWDREIVWHAFTQMAEYEPLIIERAEGCTLFDVEGRQYLDAVSSLWCNVHGHRHPVLDQAVRRQLDQVAHVTSLGCSNPATIQLARRLVEVAPQGLTHVFFAGDGASAVEVALKMAFQYWRQCGQPRPEKRRYLAFDNAYHGDTLGSVSVGGVARFHQMFRPLLFDVLRLPAPDTYRLPPGVALEGAGDYYLGLVEQALREHHQELVAVVIEPLIQAAAGMVMHPPGFLRGVRELTRRYDVLLIADEVATGFGRTGTMFACQQEQVTPDFLCLGKGLTGGYLAMSATLTTDRVWEAFLGTFEQTRTFFHGHTYGGNPLAAAAGLATLDVFQQERTLERLPALAGRLAERLAELRKLPAVGDVRQRGLIAAVELVRDRATREPYDWRQRRGYHVCRHALQHGVWMRPLGDVLVIMPPLVITCEQLDRIALAVGEGIQRVTADWPD
ncbi:MAG: adenosylmethionine--8-amino-7-oxononanoate transaminase [Pirellulaceae bacterium]|nr:adenosylmethionine--8-amino-7-oxononanoate transaminase [Pirellulaceae bacterium]